MNLPDPDESLSAEESTAPPSLDETMQIQGDTNPAMSGTMRTCPEQWVGRCLGKYQITALLGVGGMGVVLKAHDPAIERDVAIKVLPSQLSTNETTLNRFLAEAKSAGKLNHPNAVAIYELGHDQGIYYLVMEIVSGGSAADSLERRGAFSVGEATRLAIEACRGLSAAHQQNLIHRDIKPANLLLTHEGTVKVADFGLAKHVERESMMLTEAGHLVGTPFYMSPEQCQSTQVDARSDVYSLGATYYSLLTGETPYKDAGSVVQVMFAHCNAAPPNPQDVEPSIPVACRLIIQQAMAKNPEGRYQSMDQMRVDLEAVLAAISGVGIRLPSETRTVSLETDRKDGKASRRNVFKKVAAGVGLLVAGGSGTGYFLFIGDRKTTLNGDNESVAITAVTSVPRGEPIRVGVLHSLSGTMGQSGNSVAEATLLAIEELNRNGGVLGRPVEAVVADGRSDQARFLIEARRLIEVEKVCTIFGCWTSANRKTIVPLVEELDHLLVYPLQYEGLEESPNVIYTGATPNQQVIPAVKWAYAFERKRRFFLVGSDYVFPRVIHEVIKDQLQELGAEMVGEAFLPLGSSDVSTVVKQIAEAKPDIILNSINGNSNFAFFKQLYSAGITSETVPTISFSMAEEEFRQLETPEFEGHYAAWNYFQSIDTKENAEFIGSYRRKYGPQRVVTDPMESAYFGVKLWGQAVEEAGTTEVGRIRRAMLGQRMTAPSGNVRIEPATQHTFKTSRIGRIQADGQFEIVWTGVKPEPPLPYSPSRTAEAWRAFLHDLYSGWGNRWSAPVE